jgi:hypothetical protein
MPGIRAYSTKLSPAHAPRIRLYSGDLMTDVLPPIPPHIRPHLELKSCCGVACQP